MTTDPIDIGMRLTELDHLLEQRKKNLEMLKSPAAAKLEAMYLRQTGLLSYLASMNQAPVAKDQAIEPFTEEILHHAGYRWLCGNKHYLAAWNLFQSRLDQPPSSIDRAIQTVTFVRDIVTWTAVCFCTPKWKPKTVTVAEKRGAAKSVDELLDKMRNGVRLENIFDNDRLKRLLREFKTELQTPSKREYSGRTARQELFLTSMALSLLSRHERKFSEDVILAVAPMLGFAPSTRTAQRYIANAFKKNEKLRESFKMQTK